MKESIEQSIKNSLDKHEMPYNGAAWTSMQAKLDAKMPVQPKSNFKWYVAASAIIVVAVASIIALNTFGDDSSEVDNKTAQNIDSKSSPEKIETNSIETERSVNHNASELTTNDENQSETILEVNHINTDSENEFIGNQIVLNNETVHESTEGPRSSETSENSNSTSTNNSNNTNSAVSSKPLILPTLNSVCEGDVVEIENKNNEPIVVEGNGLHYIVPANSKRSVRTKSSGNHTISALNSTNERSVSTFFVKESPSVDFTIDSDTKFEGGIPSTNMESVVPGQSFSWIYAGQKSTGREAVAHFYEKGDHVVTLTVTGSNGCKASLTKSVYIDQKYNLMAVNSFMPASTDTRKNTFMPYALTQRDTKFTLIIIDPIDGHVVYQTNDATAGWNGTDITTGSLVSYESAYIWKVIIETPEKNENNEYVGNIIPVDWR